MVKKKDNNFTVVIAPEDALYTNISTSRDGYNSARIVVRKGDNEYLNVSYEWEGKGIPDFAMSLMSFMKNNAMETSGVWPGKEEAFKEYSKIKTD